MYLYNFMTSSSQTHPRALQGPKFEANFGGLLPVSFQPESNFRYAVRWARQASKRRRDFGKALEDLSSDVCLGLLGLFEKAGYPNGHENPCHCTAAQESLSE